MAFRIQWARVGLAVLLAGPAHGSVIEFTDADDWFASVGAVTTIDFTGFPDGTFITDQYSDLGVLFNDGDDNIRYAPGGFLNDDWGLDGNWAIHLSFLTPQAYIAADYPGALQIQLFWEGELTYTSSELGGSGLGHFAGLVSSDPFDEAVIIDWVDEAVFIDDLYFGLPAPSTIVMFSFAALAQRRRRPACCQLTNRSSCRAGSSRARNVDPNYNVVCPGGASSPGPQLSSIR